MKRDRSIALIFGPLLETLTDHIVLLFCIDIEPAATTLRYDEGESSVENPGNRRAIDFERNDSRQYSRKSRPTVSICDSGEMHHAEEDRNLEAASARSKNPQGQCQP